MDCFASMRVPYKAMLGSIDSPIIPTILPTSPQIVIDIANIPKLT